MKYILIQNDQIIDVQNDLKEAKRAAYLMLPKKDVRPSQYVHIFQLIETLEER